MDFVLAALLLLGLQYAWQPPPSPPVAAPAVEALLNGGNSTAMPVRLAGRVTDAAPTFGEGVRVTLDVESADGAAAGGLVNVSLRETSRRWRTGDRMALSSRLRRITGFGNFGELDWAAYNARRGIFTTAYAWRDEDVEALAPRDGRVDYLRRLFSEACERIGGQGAEILEALVIGDRTGIDRDSARRRPQRQQHQPRQPGDDDRGNEGRREQVRERRHQRKPLKVMGDQWRRNRPANHG